VVAGVYTRQRIGSRARKVNLPSEVQLCAGQAKARVRLQARIPILRARLAEREGQWRVARAVLEQVGHRERICPECKESRESGSLVAMALWVVWTRTMIFD
jgi:hypothetical protein